MGNSLRMPLAMPASAISAAPNLVDFDFVLQKHFQLGDYGQIEFRSEFFNIFNHPNLGLPGNYVDVAGRRRRSPIRQPITASWNSR